MPSQTEWVPELAGQESAEQAGKREEIVGHEQSTHRNQNPAGDHIDDTTPAPEPANQADSAVDRQAEKQEGHAQAQAVRGQQDRSPGRTSRRGRQLRPQQVRGPSAEPDRRRRRDWRENAGREERRQPRREGEQHGQLIEDMRLPFQPIRLSSFSIVATVISPR